MYLALYLQSFSTWKKIEKNVHIKSYINSRFLYHIVLYIVSTFLLKQKIETIK